MNYEKDQERRRELERELRGYKIVVRKANFDKETLRIYYTRIRELERELGRN